MGRIFLPYADAMDLITPAIAQQLNDVQDDLMDRLFNVRGYGADLDGAHDDTGALQRAIDAAGNVRGGIAYIGPGRLRLTGQVDIDAPGVRVVGAGPFATDIEMSSATLYALNLAADYTSIENLRLLHSTNTATNGGAIKATSGGYQAIRRVVTGGGWYDSIKVVDAFQMLIEGCFLFDHLHYGLDHDANVNPDQGDTTITNTTVAVGPLIDALAAINWHGGGGIRVVDNKILRHRAGLRVDPDDAVNTQGLYVKDNSIENCTEQGILLQRMGTTGVLTFAQIQNNQFDVQGDGIVAGSAAYGLGAIRGNSIRVPNTKKGIQLLAGLASFDVSGNDLHDALIGISFEGGQAAVGEDNRYFGCVTDLANASSVGDAWGPVGYRKQHLVANNTSGAYVNQFEIEMGNYQSATIAIQCNFISGGVGAAARYIVKELSKDFGGNVTVTAITDQAAGLGTFAIQFDVSTAGKVKIGVQKAGAGTGVNGVMDLRVIAGQVSAVREV